MSRVQGKPFRVYLLAATMISLLATSSFSADIETLRKQAEAGGVEAQFNLGHLYLSGQGVPEDSREAFKWFLKAAEQGEVASQYNVGVLYYKGQGVPQDFAEAVKWHRKAAEQGYAMAQFQLGNMFSTGRGVPQDYAEGVKWYRKAAEQGHVKALRVLGIAYILGYGVPQDYVQSYFWSSLAASSASGDDFKEAMSERDRAAKLLTPEKLMEAQRMTREWEKSHSRK